MAGKTQRHFSGAIILEMIAKIIKERRGFRELSRNNVGQACRDFRGFRDSEIAEAIHLRHSRAFSESGMQGF